MSSDGAGLRKAKSVKLRHVENPSQITAMPRTTQVGGLVLVEHTLTREAYMRMQQAADAEVGGDDVCDT